MPGLKNRIIFWDSRMSIVEGVRRHGVVGSFKKVASLLQRKGRVRYGRWRHKHAPPYVSPTPEELAAIESELAALGVSVEDYSPSPEAFRSFQQEGWFAADHFGGKDSNIWNEKHLEHWIARERLGLMEYVESDVYVDIAASTSPWAHSLRERAGVDAYAIDMDEVGRLYENFPYYRIENATATSFPEDSVTGASLQCAYEMFMGQDDTNFVREAARILKPGGKIYVLPLYMHTHYCAYATPEYFGKGFSDPDAKEYVNLDYAGVPSSRKYDAAALKKRVLDPITSSGLSYKLLALRNKSDFGGNIYCHFILEISK